MNQEDLRRELNIVFTAAWTPELIETARGGAYAEEEPTLSANQSSMMLKENSSTKKLLKKWECPVQTIRDSFQSWLDHETDHHLTNLEKCFRCTPAIQAPQATQFEMTPVEPTGGSTMIRDATTHYQEVAALNNARHTSGVTKSKAFRLTAEWLRQCQ